MIGNTEYTEVFSLEDVMVNIITLKKVKPKSHDILNKIHEENLTW